VEIRLATPLDAPAEIIWESVQKSASLRYVVSPLIGFRADFPKRWRDGDEVVRIERLMFFRILPGWSHEIRFARFDDERRELFTNERGGPIKTWNHLIKIEPLSETRCRYTDEVEVTAGMLTPFVWLYGQLYYRYRQMRWRTLARILY
jgi:hypothetical protein